MREKTEVIENPVNASFEVAVERFLLPLVGDPEVIKSIGDFGCAFFFEAPVLRNYFPTASIIGVDYDSARLDGAELANLEVEGIVYQEADLEEDDVLAGEPFDLIVFRRPGPMDRGYWQGIVRKSIQRLNERGFVLATFANGVSYYNFLRILEEVSVEKKLGGSLNLMPGASEQFAVACKLIRSNSK